MISPGLQIDPRANPNRRVIATSVEISSMNECVQVQLLSRLAKKSEFQDSPGLGQKTKKNPKTPERLGVVE